MIGEFFIQKMREADKAEAHTYDTESVMSTRTITQMIAEFANQAERQEKAEREKAKAAYEKQLEETQWSDLIHKAVSSGVVDTGEIIEEVCRMREQGMSLSAAQRMIRSIIRQEKLNLEEIQKAAPKPAAYGSWA